MSQVNFCRPIIPNFNNLEKLLKESIDSGQLSNFGILYEKAVILLKEYLKVGHKDLILTSSGHTALMAAYSVLGIQKIVIPNYTFSSTLQAARLQNIDVSIIDINEESATISVQDLESLSFDYDAVVIVCPLSIIPPLEELSLFCKANNKKLIIDGAATFGSSSEIFSYGDAYCLSFHATKTLSVGEGGAVIINKGYEEKVKSYITFGMDKEKNIQMCGINGKISEYSCAILIDLLLTIEDSLQKRINNISLYQEYLSEFFIPSHAERTVYTSAPLFLPEGKKEDAIKRLNSEGFTALSYYKPLVSGFIHSANLFNRNVCLPSHHEVREEDIDKIIKIIKLYL